MGEDRWEQVGEKVRADLEADILPEDIERKHGLKTKTGFEYVEWYNRRTAKGKCVFPGVYTLYCIGNGFRSMGRRIAKAVKWAGERERPDDFSDMMNPHL